MSSKFKLYPECCKYCVLETLHSIIFLQRVRLEFCFGFCCLFVFEPTIYLNANWTQIVSGLLDCQFSYVSLPVLLHTCFRSWASQDFMPESGPPPIVPQWLWSSWILSFSCSGQKDWSLATSCNTSYGLTTDESQNSGKLSLCRSLIPSVQSSKSACSYDFSTALDSCFLYLSRVYTYLQEGWSGRSLFSLTRSRTSSLQFVSSKSIGFSV